MATYRLFTSSAIFFLVITWLCCCQAHPEYKRLSVKNVQNNDDSNINEEFDHQIRQRRNPQQVDSLADDLFEELESVKSKMIIEQAPLGRLVRSCGKKLKGHKHGKKIKIIQPLIPGNNGNCAPPGKSPVFGSSSSSSSSSAASSSSVVRPPVASVPAPVVPPPAPRLVPVQPIVSSASSAASAASSSSGGVGNVVPAPCNNPGSGPLRPTSSSAASSSASSSAAATPGAASSASSAASSFASAVSSILGPVASQVWSLSLTPTNLQACNAPGQTSHLGHHH